MPALLICYKQAGFLFTPFGWKAVDKISLQFLSRDDKKRHGYLISQ